MPERNPEELELLALLKRNHPGDYDRVMDLYSAFAEAARESLEKAAAFGAQDGVDPAEVASDVIFKGFITIHVQMGGVLDDVMGDVQPATNFAFSEETGLTLFAWLKCLMGAAYPALSGDRSKLGMLWTHNRRESKRMAREIDLEDNYADEGAASENDTNDIEQMVREGLSELTGRQRFIVEARFGLPENLGFGDVALAARLKASGLPIGKIKSRAKRAKIEPNAEKLQMQQIAAILDLSDEQVRRDFRAAKEYLQHRFGGDLSAA